MTDRSRLMCGKRHPVAATKTGTPLHMWLFTSISPRHRTTVLLAEPQEMAENIITHRRRSGRDRTPRLRRMSQTRRRCMVSRTQRRPVRRRGTSARRHSHRVYPQEVRSIGQPPPCTVGSKPWGGSMGWSEHMRNECTNWPNCGNPTWESSVESKITVHVS